MNWKQKRKKLIAIISEILGIEVDSTNAAALANTEQKDIKRAYYKQVARSPLGAYSLHNIATVLGIPR